MILGFASTCVLVLVLSSVAKKALEGGGESSLPKMGVDRGFFNVLVSQNSRNFYRNFHLQPLCLSIYCSDAGKEEYWY